jgi:hypothetical protein
MQGECSIVDDYLTNIDVEYRQRKKCLRTS